MGENHKAELDRHFARFEARLPQGAVEIRRLAAQAVVALRQDSARHSSDRRWYPELLADTRTLDVAARPPFVRVVFPQKPMARMLGWIERKWIERRASQARAMMSARHSR